MEKKKFVKMNFPDHSKESMRILHVVCGICGDCSGGKSHDFGCPVEVVIKPQEEGYLLKARWDSLDVIFDRMKEYIEKAENPNFEGFKSYLWRLFE